MEKWWKLIEERVGDNGEVQRIYMRPHGPSNLSLSKEADDFVVGDIKKRNPGWLIIALLAIVSAFAGGLLVGETTGHNKAECEWSSAIQLWIDMGLEPRDPDTVMKERICAFKKDLEADRLRRIQEKGR